MSRASELSGRTVFWTGLDESAEALLSAFIHAGAKVERTPLLRCTYCAAPEVFQSVQPDTWIVFTSARAVDAITSLPLPQARYATVGPASADRLRALGRDPDLVPETHNAEGLAAALKETAPLGHVLFLSGNKALPTLPNQLRDAGFVVEEREVYRTAPVSNEDAARVAERIRASADVVLFGSPEGVRALRTAVSLQSLAEKKPRLILAALGKTTAATLADFGILHPVIASSPAPDDVVRAVEKAVKDSFAV